MSSATTPTVVSIATMPTSMTDAEATRLGYKEYTHGVVYNSGITLTLTGGAGFSHTRSSIIPYQTKSGSWRLKFNIGYNQTSSTSYDINISGVTFEPIQQVSFGHFGTATSIQFSCTNNPGDDYVLLRGTVALANNLTVSGDVALASKPTWAF